MDKRERGFLLVFFGIVTAICMNADAEDLAIKGETAMVKVKITIGNTVSVASMEDNPVARDFISLMPLTIKMQDLAHEEKYGYASRKLRTDGMKSGYDPAPGDICCYAPWGNVCIYYGDHGYESLVKLGSLDLEGINALAKYSGDVTVTFVVDGEV